MKYSLSHLLILASILACGCDNAPEKCGTSAVADSPQTNTNNGSSTSSPTGGQRSLFGDDQNNSTGCPVDSKNYSATIPNRLSFFGYFALLLDSNGKDSDLDEVKDYTNLIFIVDRESEKLEKIKNINLTEGKSLSAILNPPGVFFDENHNLYADYEKRWTDFSNKIMPYKDLIKAFYPIDEPYDSNNGKNTHSVAEMNALLDKANALIKKSFPDKAIAVIFSAGSLYKDDFAIASSIDWVSFDCYGGWNQCGDEDKSIPEYYDKLKTALHSHQKTFLVQDATGKKENISDKEEYAQTLIARSDSYYQLCNNDPQCIGLMPFIYQTLYRDNEIDYYGARDFTGLVDKLKSIGQNIIKDNISIK